ncbi:hypothetical protein Ptr902_03857 [Pyrenophora tritici-repentis]|nr:hypothetical protein Ptr902_03857 [Pyrenophora tritici-repentis]
MSDAGEDFQEHPERRKWYIYQMPSAATSDAGTFKATHIDLNVIIETRDTMIPPPVPPLRLDESPQYHQN